MKNVRDNNNREYSDIYANNLYTTWNLIENLKMLSRTKMTVVKFKNQNVN